VHYVRAQLANDEVTPLAHQVSGDLRSISRANALVVVPSGVDTIPAGETVVALLLDSP
jgi:molybdopterin biosynthesis enzyme